MDIIDGKKWAQEITESLKVRINNLADKGITLTLGIILIGNDPSSEIYVRNKEKKCAELGIKTILQRFPENVAEEKVIKVIDEFNKDENITGILLQSPLPKHLDEKKIMQLIKPNKDADGFNLINMGAIITNDERILAATPKGIITLLAKENIALKGKHCVIVGRSNIVGRPLAMMLLNRDATVTITHRQTKNLKEITKQADILIVAIGQKEFITADYVKEGAVIIDVGINRVDGKIYGDVDINSVKEKASKITPVPGGVGPMTVAMLIDNIVTLGEKDGSINGC